MSGEAPPLSDHELEPASAAAPPREPIGRREASSAAAAMRPGERRLLGDADERLGEQIARHLGGALKAARGGGEEVLAALTCELPGSVDPAAAAFASRRPGEPWFCLEQPERGGVALAALGEVVRLEASGGGRFQALALQWRALASRALSARLDAPRPPGGAERGRSRRGRSRSRAGSAAGSGGRGPGPVAVGGFSFAVNGCRSSAWGDFQPARFVVPEVALRREGEATTATLCARVRPDDVAERLASRLESRLAELRSRPLPLLDPAPAGRVHVASAMPPEHYEAAVARAVELIGRGELEKIVLAREVHVQAPTAYDPPAIFGVLREVFPSCFILGTGRGDSAFLAASPELLVRREGQRVSTLALAGSARRSADPAVDDHLGEQLLRSPSHREEHEIVVRRIERALAPHAVWVAASPEPALARIANIQHLATPIRAQLAAPMDALELAGALHPTPAVGGEPAAAALELIPALEGLDRGWYSAPVGWIDAAGDGELCVALRCALLRERLARCYAGNGIVRGSDPAAELAETELKLQALLPLLTG